MDQNSSEQLPITEREISAQHPSDALPLGSTAIASAQYNNETRPLREKRCKDYFGSQKMYDSCPEHDRLAINHLLNKAIDRLLFDGQAVYLEGLGILYTTSTQVPRSHLLEGQIVVRLEAIDKIQFEKCAELTSFQRTKFDALVESRELARLIYPQLPLASQVRWNLDDTKQVVRGFCRSMKEEIIKFGFSSRLDRLGTFFALHNRHGASPSDWFAGSDIFLDPARNFTREVGSALVHERPLLDTPFELFDAAFGKTVLSFSFSPAAVIKSLGLDLPEKVTPPLSVQVCCFVQNKRIGSSSKVYHFCTNGFSQRGSNSKHPACEFVTSIVLQRTTLEQLGCDFEESVAKFFAVGWLSRTALSVSGQATSGQELNRPLITAIDQPFWKTLSPAHVGLLVDAWGLVSIPQLCAGRGEINFQCITALTADEVATAARFSPARLLPILKRRGAYQISKLPRKSCISESEISSESTPNSRLAHSPVVRMNEPINFQESVQ